MTVHLTAWYALAVTATVVVALGAGHWLLKRESIGSLGILHEAEFREVLQQLGGDPERLSEADLAARMARHSEADEHLFFFQVHDAAGRLLFRSPNLGETILPTLPAYENPWTVDMPLHGRVHGSEFEQGGLHFQIGSRLEPMERLLRQYLQISLVLTAMVAAGSVGLGYGISRVALNPIRAIERTARRIGADHLSERIPVPPGRDEVAKLVKLLNAMFDRLETSFRQVSQFSADASHELKTPLTLIRLNAESLRKQLADNAESAVTVDTLLEEIARMNRIINDLLFLAKAEGGGITAAREVQPTLPFILSVAEDARVLAEDGRVRLEVEVNEPVAARFNQGLLRQVLLNLVGNATAVMPSGGTVKLRSLASNGYWRIEVLDEGPGLLPENLERVFERFVKLPRPDPTTGHGNGLGLAISRSIMRLHGGDLFAANRQDRTGLCMIAQLPVG